jgi:hypothetical protein
MFLFLSTDIKQILVGCEEFYEFSDAMEAEVPALPLVI